jgi:integrase
MIIRDHKTSATMGPKHLPLNGPLKVILQHRAGVTLDKLVFPGLVKDKPIQGLRHMWLRVLAVEGCELGEATPHDLRRTFMTVTVELGYPPAIGDTLLGHSLGKITDTYTRLSMDGILANASKDAAQWIAAAMRGENPKVGVKLSLDAGDKIMA